MIDITTDSTQKAKNELYQLYFYLQSAIKGQKVNIDKVEYQMNLELTTISSIINYIKESIGALVKKEVKIYEKSISSNPNYPNDKDKLLHQFEQKIKKLENDIRYLTKKQFQYKLKLQSLEYQLKSYIEMEESFEEMKEKLKYEAGEFLNNDRKDNEIYILQAENSNLKKCIDELEEKKKFYITENEKIQETVQRQNAKIDKLIKKIAYMEKMQKEYLILNNYNNNINQNWSIKPINGEEQHYHQKSMLNIRNKKLTKEIEYDKTEINFRKQRIFPRNTSQNHTTYQGKGSLISQGKENFNSSYKRIFKSLSGNKSLKNYNDNKNSTVTMGLEQQKKNEEIEKYFSNNNYIKLSNFAAIPNERFPISNRALYNDKVNPITKLYSNNRNRINNKNYSKSTINANNKSSFRGDV